MAQQLFESLLMTSSTTSLLASSETINYSAARAQSTGYSPRGHAQGAGMFNMTRHRLEEQAEVRAFELTFVHLGILRKTCCPQPFTCFHGFNFCKE